MIVAEMTPHDVFEGFYQLERASTGGKICPTLPLCLTVHQCERGGFAR